METSDKVSILLVDDDPAKILALESVLCDLNENLVKVHSGEEALRALLQHDFAVILLDVNMPRLDGFETAKLIRERQRSEHTPIIFITSINTADAHVSQGYSLGAVDYIFTPVVPEILKAKVSVFVELWKKNAQLIRQAEDLIRSNNELEQFAYLASHDLQEPLRMVSCYTQLLATRYKGKLDAEADDFIARTIGGVERMATLVNDLLSYARAGGARKDFVAVNCESLLEMSLQVLKPSIDETKAEITHGKLPSLMADEVQLGQVFQNLIANALKFRSKETPKIHVSCEKKSKNWIFSVTDNGIGIDPKYSQRIFLIFQRLHTQAQYPGTGIGLAICKKVVEYHGGKIWVESELGKGTTFMFSVPFGAN